MQINQGNFLYAISKIRQNLFAYLEREMHEKGILDISPSDGDILYSLDRRGDLSIGEIAGATVKDKSTVSSVVKKLEQKGYVTKKKTGEDGRIAKISITQKGKKVRPALWKISAAMNEKIFRGLTEDEKNALFDIMGKIYKNAI